MKKIFYLAVCALIITSCGNKQASKETKETPEHEKMIEYYLSEKFSKDQNEKNVIIIPSDSIFFEKSNVIIPTSIYDSLNYYRDNNMEKETKRMRYIIDTMQKGEFIGISYLRKWETLNNAGNPTTSQIYVVINDRKKEIEGYYFLTPNESKITGTKNGMNMHLRYVNIPINQD